MALIDAMNMVTGLL